MKSKWLVIGIVIIIIVLGGMFLFLKTNNQASNNSSLNAQPTNQTRTTSAPTVSSTATEKTVEVTLTSQGFSPSTITIDKGTKVVWTNKSGEAATINSDPHPFHTDYAPLNLGSFNDGEKLELVFNKSGTYKYHNHLNASEKGTIVVK